MNEEEFFASCVQAFGFLKSDFGFRVVSQDSTDVGMGLSLKNRTTGIRVLYEFREYYVFVKLCQLVQGDFVFVSGEIRPDTTLYCFDLDDLLSIRSPESIVPSFQLATVLNAKLIERVLFQQAENLRRYAQDVLCGDFSVFETLDRIVKARAREAALRKWGHRARELGW